MRQLEYPLLLILIMGLWPETKTYRAYPKRNS